MTSRDRWSARLTDGKLISVVDDDESIRDSTRTLLRSAGYDVATFTSSESFLESGALSGTQCLILDIRMPGMSGLELQRRVNLLDPSIPIIFVTAHDDKRNRTLAADAGASDFFKKPFPANSFLSAIHMAIEKSDDRRCPRPTTIAIGKDEGGPMRSEMNVVYVVDDEKVIADTLAMILKQSGFGAVAFEDPCKALAAATEGPPPDLLISDVVMPGMSGIELAIQFQQSYPRCKVLLFSGQAVTADLLETARLQGYQFEVLQKPVHPSDLLAKLRAVSAPSAPVQDQEIARPPATL